jgi:hypothetical protein
MNKFNYDSIAKKTIIDTKLEENESGCYCLIDSQGYPYYIGRFFPHWNKDTNCCYKMKDRILMHTEIRNDYLELVTRGHIYTFVLTLNRIMTNEIYFQIRAYGEDKEPRKRNFIDYWYDANGKLRSDNLINWMKTSKMFDELCQYDKLRAQFMERDLAKEPELIQKWKPYANQEHSLNEYEKYLQQEEAREELYRKMNHFCKTYPPIELK